MAPLEIKPEQMKEKRREADKETECRGDIKERKSHKFSKQALDANVQ